MVNHKRRIFSKWLLPLMSFSLVLSLLIYVVPVRATSLINRSITMDSVTAAATTNHQFQFNITTNWSLGSVAFQYCEAPLLSDPCVPPSGIDVSAATLTAQTGETGFSMHPNTSSNRLVITRTPFLSSPGTVSYDFNNILNPDTANHTTYVRITTYTNSDAVGNFQDDGVTAFSLTPALGVNVFIPPYLIFCVGVTVGLQCEAATNLNISLGVLNSSRTAHGTSQFAGATNDTSGYSVSVLGTAMTSGNNEISQLSSPSAPITGTKQFGINLVDNSNPDSGSNTEGLGTLAPSFAYGQSNFYTYNNGDVIGNTNSPTEYNRMTVTYMVNIEPRQAPGIYSTTITYVALATF